MTAFGHSADAKWKTATVQLHNPFPALAVERKAVGEPEVLGFIHILLADRGVKRLLKQHLQPEEKGGGVLAAAALQISPHGREIRGVLQPVAGLIAIAIKQNVDLHSVRSEREKARDPARSTEACRRTTKQGPTRSGSATP